MTFDEAKAVLLDPYALTREDLDVVGEQRFVTLGMGVMDRIVVYIGGELCVTPERSREGTK